LGTFHASPDRLGALSQHLVVDQIHATVAARDEHLDLFNFGMRGGLAEDFIARFGRKLRTIEAKAGTHVTEHDAASLLAAKAYLPGETRLALVTPAGAPRRLPGGVSVLALSDLLRAMCGEKL
jgi:hypothetical protein